MMSPTVSHAAPILSIWMEDEKKISFKKWYTHSPIVQLLQLKRRYDTGRTLRETITKAFAGSINRLKGYMLHYVLFGIQEGKKELEDGNVGGDFIIKENENALPRDKLLQGKTVHFTKGPKNV